MSYQVANTSDKAICFTMTDIHGNKEDISLYPNNKRTLDRSSMAHVDFHAPVDFTFRQKHKGMIMTKTKKEFKEKVLSVDLPTEFVLLKIKKVYI